MTRLGILLPEATDPYPEEGALPAAAAAYDGPLDVVPIIVRDRVYPIVTVDAIRAQGREPVIYLTSHGWDHKDPSSWDVSPLRDWPKGDILVRFDQEPNGDWAAPWAGMQSRLYRQMFDGVREALSEKALISFAPIWTGRTRFETAIRDYWTGRARISLDIYATQDARGLARNLIRAVTIIRRHYSGPIDVWESGILRGLPRRRKGLRDFLRTADDLGIERVVYLDRIGLDPGQWDTAEAARHDWRMSRGMRRAWKEAGCR